MAHEHAPAVDGHVHDHSHDHAHDHEHNHAHGHLHDHGGDRKNEKRIAIAALLTGGFMGVELAGGVLAGSLALIADAGHMLSDFGSLALAWIGFRMARRPADARRTFGLRRFPVLAAFVNGLTLFVIVIWIAYEAAMRLMTPHAIEPVTMLWVAALGLGVNVASFAVLHGADRDNLNVRGALLHTFGDRIALGLRSAGEMDFGEDVRIHCHLVHRDRTHSARTDHQNLGHISLHTTSSPRP